MSTLLPFHNSMLSEIHDPSTSDLVVLARGLGLRRVICTLLKIYESPQNLVLLVNATQEEESEIGEELSLMGCRKPGLRVVGYETGTSRDRQDLYKKGGIISITSRILVVDMLQNDISVDRITGIVVLHAERVSPLHLVSFITRLYREKNNTGFLKAFTDQPEHITAGISPLKSIMKELQLRRVSIWPRFHQEIKQTLERRRADVVELSQHLTDSMSDIHGCIVQCMNSTLAELRRSRADLDLDMLNLPNAYFPFFDHTVRKQLDPVWHKVGSTTKALARDLGVLRRLVGFLLYYDPLQFHAYCETLITSQKADGPNAAGGQWMLSDAANVIFSTAKLRCYLPRQPEARDELEDEFDILDELEGRKKDAPDRPKWLPPEMEPVLEELPKWSLLVEVLEEIEGEISRMESRQGFAQNPGTNTTLIMCSTTQTCNILTELLSSLDQTRPKGEWGRKMMMRKLHGWLWWKKNSQAEGQGAEAAAAANFVTGRQPVEDDPDEGISEALKKKDRERQEKKASRRRVRGGGPAATSSRQTPAPQSQTTQNSVPAQVPLTLDQDNLENGLVDAFEYSDFAGMDLATDFDAHYGLLAPEETVLIKPYSDDTDDRMLEEIKPRFIVMFEPCMEFVRRVEVYKAANPGLAVRVYHMVYSNSCEEHKYLASIRREKESFERLIKERGSMLLPIHDERDTAGRGDAIIKTMSSRLAGGRRELSKQPSQVIVDMREFRSTLPSLLHASRLLVIPATLTVGDYILTPDMCVERKSLADLVSSFNSGRLYTQCELMSVHYKMPILLIEFEEDKAFSFEIVSDLKQYAKPTTKYQPKKKTTGNPTEANNTPSMVSLQSKIVLLLLTFPRVRIIWSSSPYATADIFNDLKDQHAEPDPTKAISVGAEEDPEAGAGINAAAEELLRSLPGINAKNVKYVMSKVQTVRELCEMSLQEVQAILGAEPGRACWNFIHKGDRTKKT